MKRTFKDFVRALTSPESYRDFMNYKMRYLFLYVFVMMFAAGIITVGIPAVQFLAAGGVEPILVEEIPDFKASSEDGLWIEEPVEIDEYGFLIKANSDVVYEDITDLNGQYGTYEYVIMADKEQIYLQMPGYQEIVARYDQMPGFSFTKQDILNYIPAFYVGTIWILFFAFLSEYGYYFLGAAVISWLAGIVASFMRLRLNNLKLFKMAVYAGTFSYIVEQAQMITGKWIPNFTFFSYVITLGYMFFALKEYKESGYEELPPDHIGGREE